MEGNDLSTDNLALSDELSAPSVYSEGTLQASFGLENEGNFRVTFFLQAEKASKPVYSQDISSPQEYALRIEGLLDGVTYEGKWTVSNGFDYEATEHLFTLNEKGEVL